MLPNTISQKSAILKKQSRYCSMVPNFISFPSSFFGKFKASIIISVDHPTLNNYQLLMLTHIKRANAHKQHYIYLKYSHDKTQATPTFTFLHTLKALNHLQLYQWKSLQQINFIQGLPSPLSAYPQGKLGFKMMQLYKEAKKAANKEAEVILGWICN